MNLLHLLLNIPKALLRLLLSLLQLLMLSLRLMFRTLSVSLLQKLHQLRKRKAGMKMAEMGSIFSEEMEIPDKPGEGSNKTAAPGTTVAPGQVNISSEHELAEDIQPLCEDLVQIPFEAWETFAYTPKALNDKETTKLAKRLARIIERHPELRQAITDEFLFFSSLIFAVGKRVKDEREYKRSRNRGKGQDGQDDASKAPAAAAS